MRTIRFVVLTAAAALMMPVMVSAHHSFASQYDGNKPVTLRGTINRMLWSNPHGHLFVDVKTQDGKVVTWEIETGSPGALARRGWKRSDLPVGAEVIIKGYLAKDGTANANGTSVTLVASGK